MIKKPKVKMITKPKAMLNSSRYLNQNRFFKPKLKMIKEPKENFKPKAIFNPQSK